MLQKLRKSFADSNEYYKISGVLRRMLHPDVRHRCPLQEVLASALPKLVLRGEHPPSCIKF